MAFNDIDGRKFSEGISNKQAALYTSFESLEYQQKLHMGASCTWPVHQNIYIYTVYIS